MLLFKHKSFLGKAKQQLGIIGAPVGLDEVRFGIGRCVAKQTVLTASNSRGREKLAQRFRFILNRGQIADSVLVDTRAINSAN